MKWFVAKLVFHIDIDAELKYQQFDESIRLISANSLVEAMQLAQELGINEESIFFNYDVEKVHWRFINISSLYALEEIEHGVEICSTIVEKSVADNYIHLLNRKATVMSANQVFLKTATHRE